MKRAFRNLFAVKRGIEVVIDVLLRRLPIAKLAYVFLGELFSIISILLPKNPGKVVFISLPEYCDNTEFLYREMTSRKLDRVFELIWVVPLRSRANKKLNRKSVKTCSPNFFFHMLTAKYIISTHGPSFLKGYNQVHIELWHGIPLKSLGLLSKRQNFLYRLGIRLFSQKVDYLIVTSRLTAKIFSYIFGIPEEKCIVLGQPRCSGIYKNRGESIKLLENLLKNIKMNYRAVILYMPTYRKMPKYPITSQEIIEKILSLKKFLSENNILLLIKLHPMDEKMRSSETAANIRFITDEDLLKAGLTIYDFLSAVDVLITDYSSIFFDYLLLNRPVIFYIPDIEFYGSYTGFTIDPRHNLIPGEKARTIEQLTNALKQALTNPTKDEDKRFWLCRKFFAYHDGKDAERVLNFLLQLVLKNLRGVKGQAYEC